MSTPATATRKRIEREIMMQRALGRLCVTLLPSYRLATLFIVPQIKMIRFR
eukprot:m.6070 g.6070  ORF g.6070 m.6070 type:complete len:51 (-) comp2539_c0_seq1:132-284(-)